VRQGRLYYLRGKVGREARIRERRRLIRDDAEATPEPQEAATAPEEEAKS
jgi:hypothetical protein